MFFLLLLLLLRNEELFERIIFDLFHVPLKNLKPERLVIASEWGACIL